MNRITNNKLKLETVDIYHIKDNVQVYLYTVNYFDFMDIRIQIKTNKLTDYYVKFENQFIPIESNGMLKNWPSNMFSMIDDQLRRVLM